MQLELIALLEESGVDRWVGLKGLGHLTKGIPKEVANHADLS